MVRGFIINLFRKFYFTRTFLFMITKETVKRETQQILNYPGEGGFSHKNWVGVCGPLLKTLNLFMSKIGDFPYPIYDMTKNLIPYL